MENQHSKPITLNCVIKKIETTSVKNTVFYLKLGELIRNNQTSILASFKESGIISPSCQCLEKAKRQTNDYANKHKNNINESKLIAIRECAVSLF